MLSIGESDAGYPFECLITIICMNTNIKISVIIPIYNRKEYLQECITSVLTQTLDSIEIILVDDGSDDEVKEILDKIRVMHDNVVLIQKKHEGAWAARNYGIKKAHGKYICFLDSDDYYASVQALQILYNEAEKHDAKICGGNIVDVYGDGRKEYRGEVYASKKVYKSAIWPQMSGHTRYIYNRDFIIKNNFKYQPLRRYEDPPFVLEVFLKAEKYNVINETIYCCRQYKRDRLYSYDVICDIAQGVLICNQIAKKYQNRAIYMRGLENALGSIYEQCCYYYMKRDRGLCGIIERIDKIQTEMIGSTLQIVKGEDLEEWIRPCFEVLNLITKYDAIVIYGAGNIGKALVKSGVVDLEKIIGYAVTDIRNQEENIFGFRVRELSDYAEQVNVYFIIAVSVEKRKEMEKSLKINGYKNYGFMDGRGVKLAAYLKRHNIMPEIV